MKDEQKDQTENSAQGKQVHVQRIVSWFRCKIGLHIGRRFVENITGVFVNGFWANDDEDVSDALDAWWCKGYRVFADDVPICTVPVGFEVTPPTGMPGGVYYSAIRTTGTRLHVCDVRGHTPEHAVGKARNLVELLEIARSSLDKCLNECSPDGHIHGCQIARVENHNNYMPF